MPHYQFGSGTLWGVRTDGAGPYTPQQFGTLQECGVDFSFNLKELHGTNQFPVAVARGMGKVTGKAKFARLNGRLLNDIFFAQTYTAPAQLQSAKDEAGTIPSTPYQVTVTNSATFVDDLGVYYSATGLPLTKVASTPATGQYSVAAGVYTFAAADTTLAVLISYTYTLTTAGIGGKIVVTNQLMGHGPTFMAVFGQTYNSKNFNVKLPACISGKLSFASKLEDFMVPDFDFSAFADASGAIATLGLGGGGDL